MVYVEELVEVWGYSFPIKASSVVLKIQTCLTGNFSKDKKVAFRQVVSWHKWIIVRNAFWGLKIEVSQHRWLLNTGDLDNRFSIFFRQTRHLIDQALLSAEMFEPPKKQNVYKGKLTCFAFKVTPHSYYVVSLDTYPQLWKPITEMH